jgi:hypothetical protein
MFQKVVVAILLTTGPAMAQNADPIAPWTNCLQQNVVAIDDQRSDARSIASALIAQCSAIRLANAKALAAGRLLPGERDAVVRDTLNGLRESDMNTATLLVLQDRARRRAQ